VRGICTRLGIGEFVWNEDFALGTLRKLFHSAGPHRASMRARMERAVAAERGRADAMVTAVCARLAEL
jgi:hypothetical protein